MKEERDTTIPGPQDHTVSSAQTSMGSFDQVRQKPTWTRVEIGEDRRAERQTRNSKKKKGNDSTSVFQRRQENPRWTFLYETIPCLVAVWCGVCVCHDMRVERYDKLKLRDSRSRSNQS